MIKSRGFFPFKVFTSLLSSLLIESFSHGLKILFRGFVINDKHYTISPSDHIGISVDL